MQQHPGSFRDPSGFIFFRNSHLLRQINTCYQAHYEHFFQSGLYAVLTQKKWLVPHQEIDTEAFESQTCFKVIQPERIPFITYPYEWCFSQLQEAALLTLTLQQKAFEHGMLLKDASAYNIQWIHGKPQWIDTLSFEIYTPGASWPAYRQFCQHFLAPLILARFVDIRLLALLKTSLDGIPLDLASRLCPWFSWFSLPLLTHLHLHARFQQGASGTTKKRAVPPTGLQELIQHLKKTIQRISWKLPTSEWTHYEQAMNYSPEAFQEKQTLVSNWVEETRPDLVWDIGANHGRFSHLASAYGALTVALENDPVVVERHYRALQQQPSTQVLPLIHDITNPSPDLGWNLRERDSLIRRGPADMVLMLAFIHHLAIVHNIPLSKIALFLAKITRQWLIIEFIPKEDSQVQRLLSNREDIFENYSATPFHNAFQPYFTILQKRTLFPSNRTLYLMKRRESEVGLAENTI